MPAVARLILVNQVGRRLTKAATQSGDRVGNPPKTMRLAPRASPAFEELVAAHADRINRLCYRLLGWRCDVEDVVQDVFLAALRALPEFRGQSDAATWLTRIAINTCRTHGRKRLRLRLFGGSPVEPELSAGSVAEGPLLARERSARVRRAVRKLSAKYREVVVLRYLEELSPTEIGGVLGLSRNAVDVRLNRARERMRRELADFVE